MSPPPPISKLRQTKHRLLPALLCLALTAAPSLALAANSGGSLDAEKRYIGNNGPSGNSLLIDTNDNPGSIIGGYTKTASTDANNNTVTVNGGNQPFIGHFYGGRSEDGNATGNTITINGVTFSGSITGASATTGNATGNTVTINSGTFEGPVAGGYADIATGNTVTINGGTFSGEINGGYANSVTTSSSATDNTVTIMDGSFQCNIAGGYSQGSATGNTVTIMGGSFNDASIYGGMAGSYASTAGDFKSGNTLNLHVKNITAKNVHNFSTYNFYLPSDIQSGDTMLTLTDTLGTDLSGASINAGVVGDASIKSGDTVTLIKNDNGLTTTGTTYGKLTEGVSLEYDLTIAANDTNTDIIATIADSSPNSKTKSLLETQAAALSFLNSGVDRFVSSGISSAKSAAHESSGSFSPFASVGGDSMRYDSGSYADVKGVTGSIGMAKTIDRSSGSLTFGPFIEGGRGSYDSYLDDGTHADGDTDFYGLGFFARQDRSGGSYVEGSLRLGRMSSDYASGDLVNAAGDTTRYDTDSPYYGFHLGIGQVRNVGDNYTLDLYGKYFYSRQNTEDARLSSGESYDFDSVDSNRLRVGARYANAYSKTHSTYVGVAYEYEFSGKASATYKGYDLPSPSLKGGSAMLELGYVLLPAQNGHMSADIALTGWTGQKEGVGLNARLSWGF